MLLSKRAEKVAPSVTLAITAKAASMKKQGIKVISFGAGEPDFNTPSNINNAAIEAINNGYTKYTPASGIDDLKEAIINKFNKDNGLEYTKSQIIVSTGAKQSLFNVFYSIINSGDEVIVPYPYWVSYPELIKLAGGYPVIANTTEETNFKYTTDSLHKIVSSKTKAIIINSPNNPTGEVYNKEELEKLALFAQEHDLIIISDEIYEKLVYDNSKHISVASLSEDAYNRTVVINGMSKSYSMTGWRIGYAAGPESIIKLMSSIQSHITSNPNSIAQYASLEALKGDQKEVNNMVKEFKKRRDYMVERINNMGHLSCCIPNGAFYVFVNISTYLNKKVEDTIINSGIDFSRELLEHEKVAVIPGDAFGINNYIRLSYATSMDNIKEGLNRIENFIEKIIG